MILMSRQDFSLFTTMRYTATGKPLDLNRDVPLLQRHIVRLGHAFKHFGKDRSKWTDWLGLSELYDPLQEKLTAVKKGDWRTRMLVHPGPKVEVQVIPAPAGLGECVCRARLATLIHSAVLLRARCRPPGPTATPNSGCSRLRPEQRDIGAKGQEAV
jgi:hypothetical protein